MKFVANILIILGLCLGTLGAAGFHSPSISANAPAKPGPEAEAAEEATEASETPDGDASPAKDQEPGREKHAMLFFLVGVGVLIGGGVLSKFAGGSGGMAREEQHAQGTALMGQLTHIEESIRQLHSKAADMAPADRHQALTALSDGPIYDLTNEFEHWTQVLGFDRYSRVWTGVAAGERLVHRAWSMDTDGHSDEAIDELKFAAEAFAEAHGQLKA